MRSAATDVVPPLADLGRVHIMGIAGAGMSGLARILLERGVPVSGCEARESITVAALRALGADVLHRPLRRTTSTTPTRSSTPRRSTRSTPSSSPRGPAASRCCAGPRRWPPALEGKRCVAIAGTHGKTSTTSLLTVGAQACGVDPSFAIGGNLYETGRNAHLGSGELAIVEADESDGSFLLTRPAAAVITNVEADHLENHGDLDGIHRAFEQFVDRVEPDGLVLVCADDAGARAHRRLRARHRAPRASPTASGRDADVAVSRRRVRRRRGRRSPSAARGWGERAVEVGCADRRGTWR